MPYHFQIFPLATLVMLAIAAISLLVSYALYDKLMLLGTEYHEITPKPHKISKKNNFIMSLKK